MTEVSKSETGQCQPKPSKEERDAAFSDGGGRKAVEKPKADDKSEKKDEHLNAPVGLECETRGDREAK